MKRLKHLSMLLFAFAVLMMIAVPAKAATLKDPSSNTVYMESGAYKLEKVGNYTLTSTSSYQGYQFVMAYDARVVKIVVSGSNNAFQFNGTEFYGSASPSKGVKNGEGFTIVTKGSGCTVTITMEGFCSRCNMKLSSIASHSHTANPGYDQIPGNATQHNVICATCKSYGHTVSCATSFANKKENHTWGSPQGIGTNRYHTCTKCGYIQDLPCDHSKTVYTYSDGKQCLKKCTYCGTVVEQLSHSYPTSWSKSEYSHSRTCTRCRYDDSHNHEYVKSYAPFYTNYRGALWWTQNGTQHKVAEKCKTCSYVKTSYGNHWMYGRQCKLCKYSRGAVLARPNLTLTQIGRAKTVKRKVRYKAGTFLFFVIYKYKYVTDYIYTVRASWKPVRGAKCYVADNKYIKAGYYGWCYSQTKGYYKNFVVRSYGGKMSYMSIYAAAVNSQGITGYLQKKSIRLR